jgi:hypothetical protein
MLVTAFPSPATAAPCGASIPGSTFPACYFAPQPAASTTRSAFGSATAAGSPRRRPLLCLKPVAASTTCSMNCASRLHSPSGVLPPSGSKRSTELPILRPAFRVRPISLRSPQPISIASNAGYGSTFRVRYVSGGLLFLKPLGTIFTMPRKAAPVKLDVLENARFPQKISSVFPMCYSLLPVNLLWIKRSQKDLFLGYWTACGGSSSAPEESGISSCRCRRCIAWQRRIAKCGRDRPMCRWCGSRVRARSRRPAWISWASPSRLPVS